MSQKWEIEDLFMPISKTQVVLILQHMLQLIDRAIYLQYTILPGCIYAPDFIITGNQAFLVLESSSYYSSRKKIY